MRLTTLLITLTLFSACREKQSRNLQLQEQTVTGDRVEVIYFHGKQRCMTCKSIEEQTKELLTGSLAEAVKTGQIVYRTVDISDKEGEKIAIKVNLNDNGGSNIIDATPQSVYALLHQLVDIMNVPQHCITVYDAQRRGISAIYTYLQPVYPDVVYQNWGGFVPDIIHY